MKKVRIEDLVEEIVFGWIEADLSERVEVIKKLKPGQYIPFATLPAYEKNTSKFNNIVNYLKKEEVLDIGKGDAEFGYAMPLPEKEERFRELRIFRRG